MKLARKVFMLRVLSALALIVLFTTFADANPYAHVPRAGDQVRFDATSSGQRAAWAYPDQGWLETFLRSSIDAAVNGSNSNNEPPAINRARQKAVAVNNGTQGMVSEVRAFHYRDHDDSEVQVLIKQGPLRNHLYWTTPAELVDANGRKYLK